MTEEKPKKKRNRHSVQDYLTVIEECHGIDTDCAKALGITTHGFNKRVSENETLQLAMDESSKGVFNLAQSKLWDKVKEGHWQSIEFVLTHTKWGKELYDNSTNINVNVSRIDTSQLDDATMEKLREAAKQKALPANTIDA